MTPLFLISLRRGLLTLAGQNKEVKEAPMFGVALDLLDPGFPRHATTLEEANYAFEKGLMVLAFFGVIPAVDAPHDYFPKEAKDERPAELSG